MPDLSDLPARLHALADEVAAALGVAGPAVPGEPLPTPEQAPAKPARLDVALTRDATTLTWPPAADASHWEVRDDLDPNPATRVKDVVDVPRSVRSPMTATSRPRRYVLVAVGPTGLRSEPSDPVDLPPTTPTPTPAPPPSAGGVDLSRWKLTLPVVVAGKVQEILPPALSIYQDKYFARVDGGWRFRVWHGGGTTSGSSNPRSELRERVGDDPEGYWQARKGRHVMEWSGQVNRLTKVKPHVVIAQVHSDVDDVCVWRVEADKLWLTDGDDPHGFLVDAAFQLGKHYTCRYEIVNGDYQFFYNGVRLDYPLRSTAKSYFKCGLYLQSNPKTAPSESIDEYAEVLLASVRVEHST